MISDWNVTLPPTIMGPWKDQEIPLPRGDSPLPWAVGKRAELLNGPAHPAPACALCRPGGPQTRGPRPGSVDVAPWIAHFDLRRLFQPELGEGDSSQQQLGANGGKLERQRMRELFAASVGGCNSGTGGKSGMILRVSTLTWDPF